MARPMRCSLVRPQWSNFQLAFDPSDNQAVDDALTAVPGREAAGRGKELTMREILTENLALEFDLKGL